ncbi:hypothetical protein BS47DRAFT_1359429 [Hydnum rufescens UP504]|uniref:Septum-promoting GTP-binding protein 1 n=1 Tax=Hydnum rufescens UP504 TaxID=1448309 RepID=A0A9P6B660_9AGAM|nr:hypothetical protein BS47DRAFT_1359429 [Hydnum rufescens UP504]
MASSSAPSGSGANAQSFDNNDENSSVVIKVGMVGDSQIGKTSLMVKYVEGSFDEDYIQTLGSLAFSLTTRVPHVVHVSTSWRRPYQCGGRRSRSRSGTWVASGSLSTCFPLVCNDAVAILFMFDLSRKSTLNSVKEWYRQARGFNKTAIPFLVGTKFDTFSTFPRDEQEEITKQVAFLHLSESICWRIDRGDIRQNASINVQKIFKIVLAKAFDLKCVIPEIDNVGEPVLLYTSRRPPTATYCLDVHDIPIRAHAACIHATPLCGTLGKLSRS